MTKSKARIAQARKNIASIHAAKAARLRAARMKKLKEQKRRRAAMLRKRRQE